MPSRSPVFRVETYEISATEFTGTVYRLYLRHELSENYFPMLMWGVAANAAYATSEMLVRVTADPYGTGDLSVAGGNYLELTRATASNPCAMKVVVVECLRDEEGAGFQLLDVQATSLAASVGTGVQSTSDTSGTAWKDASRVVLFGGYRGGGMSGSASGSQLQTGGTRIYPSSTATINIDRYASGASNLAAVTCCTFVVQWGLEWLVQRNTVSGTNTGATLASTGHYSTSALGFSVLRLNSFIWSCGYTDGTTAGASFLGQVATIGDGVSQLGTETVVAVGGMAAVGTRSVEVYTLTHQQLAVEYDFRATGSGAGASSLTVAAYQVAETYRTASGLYGVSTAGERLALCMAGVTLTGAGDVSEVQIHARPTASTVVTATPADTSPAASWAGWNETVDFGSIDTPAGKLPVFRVTTYRVGSGQFTGTTYTLALLYTLESNYFVQIQGATAGASTQDVDDVNARVTSDPAGTDDLEPTGSNGLILTRAAAGADWVGTVTVVECLRSSSRHGFRLLAVKDVTLPTTTADYQITETTLSGVTYTDLDRVQVLVGYRGAGLTTDGSGSTSGHSAAGAVYGRPYSSNGIRLHRKCSATMLAVTACAYVIEWGTAWTLQRQMVSAVAGGTGVNATSEYSSPSLLASVLAAKSALFASAICEGANATMNYAGVAATLGDGVTVGTAPAKVAVGVWSGSANPYEVLAEVLTHADLAVDQTFQASDTGTTAALTVDAPSTSEHYGTYNSVTYTCGRRLAMSHTACSLSSDAIAAAVVQSRHTGKTTQTWLRDRADASSIAGWFQSIDLGGIYAESDAVQVDDSDDENPTGYWIFQDPSWDGANSLSSATSQGGRQLGIPEASTSNLGFAQPYAEGDPTADTELTLYGKGGTPGVDGSWFYRLSTETTAADWKALNALTIFHRTNPASTSGSLYANALVYSTVYDRVVVAWVSSASLIQIRYQAGGDTLGAWSSTTLAVEDAVFNYVGSGLAMCELNDGTLALMYQTSDGTAYDQSIAVSTDGGLTWTHSIYGLSKFAQENEINFDNGYQSMASSGDYVRILGLTEAAFGAIGLGSAVSADRGASWKISDAIPDTVPSSGIISEIAFDLVGLDDVSGSFMAAMVDGTNTDQINVYFAVGMEDWEVSSDLEWDLSSYGTDVVVKGIWMCRDPQRIWMYAWIEGTDVSEVACRWCDRFQDPQEAGNWQELTNVSAFSGVLDYGPHRPRAVWAGNRILWSGGIHDPDAVGNPIISGHWFFESGQWDPKVLAPSNLDRGQGYYLYRPYAIVPVFQHNLLTYQYEVCLGDPTADALTPYTTGTVGGGTVTWTSSEITCTATTTQTARINLTDTPGADADAWGYTSGRGHTFDFRIDVDTERVTATTDDVAVRIMAPTTSSVLTTGYDISIRIGLTSVVIYDNVAAAILATISSTTFAAMAELRVTMKAGKLWVAWRATSAAPLGAWTENGGASGYTMTSGAIAGQILRMGCLTATGASGTAVVKIYGWKISRRSDLGQAGDVSKPTDVLGAPMDAGAILVTNKTRIGWVGAGAREGDTWTVPMEYQRGVNALGMLCPRFFWESTDLSQNALVFQAASTSYSRWQLNALLLVGTVDRTATLEFSAADSWTSPAESVELDATLWEDLSVVAVDGCALQLEAASGETFYPYLGQTGELYLRITVGGSATGYTFQIATDHRGDGWVKLKDASGLADLATLGVEVGAKACIYADRMVYLGAEFSQYRYFRVVFSDLSGVSSSRGTYTGTHRIGAMIPGRHLEQNPPFDEVMKDVVRPVSSEYRSRAGVGMRRKEGPPFHGFKLSLAGHTFDDEDNGRQNILRSIRGLLALAQQGDVRPVGIVLDSTRRDPDRLLYGVLEGGTEFDVVHWTREAPDGFRHPAETTDFTFREEV